MAHGFELDNEKKILELIYSNTLTIPFASTSRAEAAVILGKYGWLRLLIDVRQASLRASTMEMFHFNASHRATFPLGVRIAILCAPGTTQFDDFSFGASVSTNRGVPERVFDNKQEAVKWLLLH